MKKCSGCKNELTIDLFSKDKTKKDGYDNQCKICRKESRVKNCEYWRQWYKEYYQKNKKERDEYTLNYNRIRRATDIEYKMATYLRNRLYQALKGNYKKSSAIKELGCSMEDFKKYIEKQFQSGMSWENYGKWHLDHIMPLSLFDLQDIEQFKKACHYTNYQPLWAIDNFKKGNRLS